MESKAVPLPLDKFKDGNFYQIKAQEAKRMAQRIFQIYDKDASKTIGLRESKAILREIYKTFKPKVNLKTEEYQEFFNQLRRTKKDNVYEADFLKITEEYFVTYSKKGSLDKQNISPELYDLDIKIDKESGQDPKKMRDILFNEASQRFGKDFAEYQRFKCKQLFDEHNKNNDDKIEYDEIVKILEHIYTKINFLRSNEHIDKDDVLRLMNLINFDNDGKIGFLEFEIFYFKSMLGS